MPGPEFIRPQDKTDFGWTSIVDASPAASGGCELHAVETLGVAIAAVEELVLDIAPPPYCEDAYDELSSQPTPAPLPADPPVADPAWTPVADPAWTDAPLADAEASLSDSTLAAPELLDAPLAHASLVDESWADADLPLADESLVNKSSDDSPVAELLLGDSPASPLVNAITEPLELPERLFEYTESLATGDEKADGDTQLDVSADVQIDAAQEEPVVQLLVAEKTGPELAPVESQPVATLDQLLEPAAVELPSQSAFQELQELDVSQNAAVVDFAVEGNGPAILVVDDSPTVRKLVTMTLTKHGYRVFSAADGVAAIEAIHACEPALVILDIDTPHLDGYKFCNLVKKGETTKGINVVMLSGKDGIFDKVRRRMSGCTDTLTKPFSPETLLSMVEKFVVLPSQHLIPGQFGGSIPDVAPLSTKNEADISVEPCARPTAEPIPGGLDNHCILHLSRLEHQVSLLHNPTTAEGCQQALQTARTILADTLEFLQATERQELLDRNRDDICRVLEEIKKVDQLLEWPSLWGLLGLRTSAEQTQQQAFDELGVGYATLLESLLTQIGATFLDESHAAEWEASVRPLLVDIKRLW